MEHLSIERLRSPRRSSGSIFYPESGHNSGSSTPYMSAPSSPRGYYYYSAPPTPPRDRSEDLAEAAVPFAWEEKPGTPKGSDSKSTGFRFGGEDRKVDEEDGMKSSVDHLTAMGFHFTSAPVSPQREFDFMNGYMLQKNHQVNSGIDEFEFSSARMSDADSVASVAMSHADELFFQGQILPLKLPPRLQQKSGLSLQVQEFSPKSAGDSSVYSPRGARAGSAFVHQLHSPRTPKSAGFSRPPAAYGYPKSPRRSKSPSKLVKDRSQDENKSPTRRLQPEAPTNSNSSFRRTLKELLHINTSSGSSRKSSNTAAMRKQDSVNSSGTDSQKSSRSSSSSSQRFSDSRSSSVSSNKSLNSARSSSSSKQVSPAPHDFMQSYNRNYKTSNADELRRRTFLPYKQGLLGCISCISPEAFGELHEVRR